METFLPYLVQALGGAVGGNIFGAITRGGGGVVGRTLLGAIGGVGLAFTAGQVEAIGNLTATWGNLLEGENGAHLANLITGAAGGGVVGLITGLLIRPRY
ncbi:MAG: hypothetical protein NVV62_18150 [Terricaulis sp.]|nr:hypothetical protein [Terricaulis sp.]